MLRYNNRLWWWTIYIYVVNVEILSIVNINVVSIFRWYERSINGRRFI